MLRLGRMTDYGIELMGRLARKADGPCNTRDLASGVGLSVTTAAKILKQLQDGGLLRSTRGTHGGYSLAKPAGTITLHEIVVVLEGPITMSQGSTRITHVVCEALVSLTL